MESPSQNTQMSSSDLKKISRECRSLRAELVKVKQESSSAKEQLLQWALASNLAPTHVSVRLASWRALAAFDSTPTDFERDNLILALSAQIQSTLLDASTSFFRPSNQKILQRIQPLCEEALGAIKTALSKPQDLAAVNHIRFNSFKAQFLRHMAILSPEKQRKGLVAEARSAYENAFAVREVVSAVQPSRLQMILAFADLLFEEYEEVTTAIELLSIGVREAEIHTVQKTDSQLSTQLLNTMRTVLGWYRKGEKYARFRIFFRTVYLKTKDELKIAFQGAGTIEHLPVFVISSCLAETPRFSLGEQEPTEDQLHESLKRAKYGEAIRLKQAFREELQYFRSEKTLARQRLLILAVRGDGDAAVALTFWRSLSAVDSNLSIAESELVVSAYYNYLRPLVRQFRSLSVTEAEELAVHVEKMYKEVSVCLSRVLDSSDLSVLSHVQLLYFKAAFLQLMAHVQFAHAHSFLDQARTAYARGLEVMTEELEHLPVVLRLAANLAEIHAYFGEKKKASFVLETILDVHMSEKVKLMALNMPEEQRMERHELIERVKRDLRKYARARFFEKITKAVRRFIHLFFPFLAL